MKARILWLWAYRNGARHDEPRIFVSRRPVAEVLMEHADRLLPMLAVGDLVVLCGHDPAMRGNVVEHQFKVILEPTIRYFGGQAHHPALDEARDAEEDAAEGGGA